VWLVAPESTTQSVTGAGGAGVGELKQPARNDGSHSPNHDVEGGNCCGGGTGGKGGVSEGPTNYGATKKACGADQYKAPPMYGSWKCDQYRAPPMHGSRKVFAAATAMKRGRPTVVAVEKGPAAPAVPIGAPTVAAAAKGSVAPATVPTGAPTAAAAAPAAVPAGAPNAATATKGPAVPTGAPMAVAAAKGSMTPAERGSPVGGWGAWW
jgi:hypothetical protein